MDVGSFGILLDEHGDPRPDAVERVFNESRTWPPEQKKAFLDWMRSARTRAALKARYASPAELARAIDPSFVITPAVKLIGDAVEIALNAPRRNLMVNMPPQEGKSTLCAVYTPVRALQLNPNCKTILATYGDELATEHSQSARGLIETHGSGVIDQLTGAEIEDKLGLSIKSGKARMNSWGVAQGSGGMVAVGLNSSTTGRRADLLIIDDPYKGPQEADSEAHRRKVSEWLRSVALTRLSPNASIILIQTRWHPLDLSGEIIAAERDLDLPDRTWRHINIPAIAEEGIKDSLGRAPGTPMESARDTDEAKRDFARTRKQVGERVWYALYQGQPAPPDGGLFSRSWFTPHPLPPDHPVATIVGIDPADSGQGDETGIIGAALAQDGTVVLTEDRSGKMTADMWAVAAVELALEIGAHEIAMEAFAAAETYERVLRRTYHDLWKRGMEKYKEGEELNTFEKSAVQYGEFPPFQIHKWRKTGDAVARSAFIRQAFEIGTARTVEHRLAVFEEQASNWLPGQHQPDRVAAALIAHDRLAELSGQRMTLAAPVNDRPLNAPAWLRRRI